MVMNKHEARLIQIRILIQELQEKSNHHNAYSVDDKTARDFINKVASIIGLPFGAIKSKNRQF